MTAQIIIAEDEASLRSIIAETLADYGFSVLQAGDGIAALELLRKNSRVALLISDIRMPRMDGFALAAAALEFRPELKILMMTGYAQEQPPPELLRAREIRTLIKPFDIERLSELVGDMLSRP